MTYKKLLFLGIFVLAANLNAADRGIPDNGVHQFAGYLGIPNQAVPAAEECSVDTIYFSCGAYLVDVESIAPGLGLPERRILLTAGHCVDVHDNDLPLVVHFQEGDARVTSNTVCPATRVIGFKPTGFNYYNGIRSWSPYVTKGSGNIGTAKNDFAIILLDNEVSVDDVDKVTKVAHTPSNVKLKVADIPILGMAGFGIAGWGDPAKNGFGKPMLIDGPREKMYVEMPTNSVQTTNILSKMVFAQADQTACNGDSGSALFLPEPDADGFFITYSHVAAGDPNCRATNTSTRVDTDAFRAFVRSVAEEIKEAAN